MQIHVITVYNSTCSKLLNAKNTNYKTSPLGGNNFIMIIKWVKMHKYKLM